MSEQVSCPLCDQPVDVGEIECPHCRGDLSTMLAGEEAEETLDGVFGVGDVPVPADLQTPDDVPADAPADGGDHTGSPSSGFDATATAASDESNDEPYDASDVSKIPGPESSPQIPAAAPPAVSVAASETGEAVGDSAPIASVSSAPAAATLVLEVEGHEEVIFRGEKVRRIATSSAELQIGRRDPANAIYPDIDLREFHRQQIGFVSRQHAQIIADRGRHYLEDLGGQETTQLAPADGEGFETVPKNERRELTPGSRIMIGEAVVFRVHDPQGD